MRSGNGGKILPKRMIETMVPTHAIMVSMTVILVHCSRRTEKNDVDMKCSRFSS